MHFMGYMTLWAAAHGTIMPPYWALLIISFLACNAQTWFETGSMVTSIRNFDTERCAFPCIALNFSICT